MMMLPEITHHDAEMCPDLCGKKEPPTSTEERVVCECWQAQSGSTFQRACSLHHLSKVLKEALGLFVFIAEQLKVNHMQSELVASAQILVTGIKSGGRGHLLNLCKDLLLLDK